MNCNCECKMLNITAGTDITLAVTLRRDGKLFPVELSDSVKVNMVSQRGVRKSVSCRVGTGKVAVPLLGEDFSVGVYGVEVTGKLNGANWRTFGASVVKYTYETERGAARVIANGDTYDIVLEVGPMSDIIPTFLSQLTNDIYAVTDPYYVHTDNNFEDAYKHFFELGLVTLLEDGVLPEASEDTMNHIYLVPNEASEDVCTAYVTVKKEVVEEEEEETPENPDEGENPDDENHDEGGETPDDTPDEGGDEGGGDEPQPEPEPVTVYEWKQFGGGGGGTIQLVKVNGVALPIDEEDKSVNIDLSGKVDKVEGKGLSTNDYTTEEKTKLAGLENYDDTEIQDAINIIEQNVAALGTNKQDMISDLDTIRSGAALGATAYQKSQSGIPKTDLASDVQTSLGKADTALQEHQDLSPLDLRITTLEGIASLSVSGEEFAIAAPSDFDNPTPEQAAKVPTVGAILGCMDAAPTPNSVKPVQSGGVYREIAEQIFNQFGERLGIAPITTEIQQNKCYFGPVENGSSTIISKSDGGYRVVYVKDVKKGSVIHFTGTTSTTRGQYYGASQVEPSDTVVGMTIDHVSVISSNGNHDDYFIMPYDGVFFYGYYNSGWSDRLFNIAEPKLKTNLDVSNILEIGDITFYDNGRWTYSNSTTRLRLKSDKLLFLNSGDKIKLSSYNGARMYIAYRCIDGTTGSTGWITKDYIVEVAGQYSLILGYNPETATDIEELSERLEIWSQSSSIPSFDEFWRTKVFNFVYGISGRKEGLELDTTAKTLTIPGSTTFVLKDSKKETAYYNVDSDVVVNIGAITSTTAIIVALNISDKTISAYSYSNYRATSDNYIVACVRFQSTGGNYTISSLLPYSINGSKFGIEYNRAVGIGGKSIYIDYCPLRKTVTIPADSILYLRKGGVEVVVTTPNDSDTVVDLSSISSSAIVIYYDNTAGAFGACAYNQYNKGNWFYVAGIRTMKSGYNNSFTSPFAWSINGKPFGLGRKQIRCNTGVKIMAHRGANFANAPENSLDAYRLAGFMGYDYAETDFCPTSDGVLVLMHDDTINRTMRNKSDYSKIQETVTVASKTYSELRNNYVLASDDVRMRRPIPTLEEYFKTCRESGVFPIAEIKSYGITEQHILEAFEMGRAILGDGNFGFASTAQALLDYARTLSERIPLLYLGVSILNTVTAAGVSRNHPLNIWYPSYSASMTDSVIREYRTYGMQVGLWLLGSYANNFDIMQRLGASIICCDVMAPSIKSSYGIVYNLEDFTTTGTIDGNVVKLNKNQRISLYTSKEKLGIYYLSIIGKGNYSVVASKLSAGNAVDNATPQRNVWQGIIDNSTIHVEVKALADGVEIEFVNYCVLPIDF